MAYTVGRDVVFASREYAPATTAGRRLIAHELAHVLQQQQTTPDISPSLAVGSAAGAEELEAETAAQRVLAGSGGASVTLRAPAAVRRKRAKGDAPPSQPLTRREEIERSRTSPGKVAATVRPPVVSIYNFAIDRAELKEEHRRALAEFASMVRDAGASNLRVVTIGHTDSSGPESVNEPLAESRARSVQQVLASSGLSSVPAVGLGESEPVANNATAEGRSRNRRVDIYAARGPTSREPPSTLQPQKPTEDESWFCSRHPFLCLAIGALVAYLLWKCLRNPASCLPEPKLPVRPERPKPPEPRHPCPRYAGLPSGILQAERRTDAGLVFLMRPFEMRLFFEEDPDSGCDCSLGEYLQQVRGFSERRHPDGKVTDERLGLIGGPMDPGIWREDARRNLGNIGTLPYGHREISQKEGDEFLPERSTGCWYQGEDEPGMWSNTPGEGLRFHFEFRGAPVHRDHRDRPLAPWAMWTVHGDYTPSAPRTPPPKAPPGTGGPTIGPATKPSGPSDFCLGGTITCETLEFLQKQRHEHIHITEEEINQAVEIEFAVLKRMRPRPPTQILSAGDEYTQWVLSLRNEARERVRAFAR
jgi:outer membrane protein OmpA-like peptidoglycan-associated protein